MKNLRSSAPLRLKKYPAYKDSGVEWLGEIPHHWTEKRLKNTASVRVSNVDKKTVEGQVSIRLCNYVDVYYNDRITQDIEFMEATATSQQIEKFTLRAGDVLITKDSETPDDIAVPSLVVSNLEGVVCGYHLALIRPNRSTMFGPYLSRALSAVGIRDQFHNCATGVTRFGLAVNDITDANILVPPIEEQRFIASFLDRKTAEIDVLIAKKRRMIELLQEKRTAVISHSVTKGLDPNAPMKDSGVEWLGEVPRHWEVLKLKRVVAMKSGENITADQIDISGEIPVFGGNGMRGYTDNYTHEGCYVLIGRQGALCGNVNYAEGKFWASEHAVVVRPRKPLVIKWLGELLRAMNLNQYSVSAAQPGLSVDTIGNLGIPYPPIEEQQSIAINLDHEINKIGSLVEKIDSAIDKLLEYRTALISAAVTGKIDVRNEVRA